MANDNFLSGFIRLYRSISNKGWYRKSEYVHLWVHILIKANHSGREIFFNGKNIKINQGEFITGRKQLQEETGINESKIERILNFFEKSEQQIEQQKTTKNRLIRVLNWENYQTKKIKEQQFEQQVNNKRTTTEQQLNTNNKLKELNNDNNEISKVSVGVDFDFFWNDYDKKVGDKIKIKKKWDKLSENDQNLILDHIPQYKISQPDKAYRKNPETYLNNKSWLDEIITKNQTGGVSVAHQTADIFKTLEFNEQ